MGVRVELKKRRRTKIILGWGRLVLGGNWKFWLREENRKSFDFFNEHTKSGAQKKEEDVQIIQTHRVAKPMSEFF